jgi:TonB-linked SusC/RagA family outer membrane protein
MKRVLSGSTALFCFVFCLSQNSYAGSGPLTAPSVIDSVPSKTIAKLKVTVRDLEHGSLLDSVYVAVGSKKGYTNSQGYIEFDSVRPEFTVAISKAGYFAQAKKAKPTLHFKLARREGQAATDGFNNGRFQRPVEHSSGSAVVVSGNELRKVNALDFAEALKFYAPSFIVTRDNNNGDNPNTTPDIKIRNANNFPASATIAAHPGTATAGVQVNPSSGDFIADRIANSNQPAFLVNGVQVSLQSALDMDINRIEKLTILKDAAATAVYGVRGGRGVVLIETARPKEGTMRVSYSGQVQVSEANLRSYNLMTAQEKLDLERTNGFYASDPEDFQARQNLVDQGLNTDWLNLPLRQGVGTKHSIAADGGNDDMRYGLDFSYNDLEGSMKGAYRKTTSFGGYVSSRMKNVVFSNHLTFHKINAANSPYGSFDTYTRQNGYWNPYDPLTGKMTKLMEEITYRDSTYRFYNPAYNGTLSTKDASEYTRLANTANVEWIIGRGFKLNGLAAYSRQWDQTDQFLPPGHTAFAEFKPEDFFKRGRYEQVSSTFTNIEAAMSLNYQKKAGLHQFYASAGASAMQTQSEATGLSVAGFTSDKISELAFGSAYTTTRPETGKIVTRLASGFGNLAYSYDNRYQAEFTGSADASSQLGKNQQVAPHWSAGASWNLHQERFFQANNILSQLRIRASAGTTGDNAYLSYLGRTSYNYYTNKQYVLAGSGPGTRGIGLGAFLTGMANDNLRAPETYTENIGLDAVLLQNRLLLSVEAYRQKSTDLVLPLVSPSYTGFQNFSYYDNLGAIKNKGIEFSLNYYIIRNTPKSIYWNISFNGLHNEEHIAATSDYLDQLNSKNDALADQTKPQPRYVVGESLTGIWAVRSQGIDPRTGKEVYLKNDGTETVEWSAADKWLVGDRAPKLQGSFGTSASIKNISIGLYANYQLDVQGYNQTLVDKVENAQMLYNTDLRAASGRWKQTGDDAPFKPVSLNGSKTSPTYASSRFVQSNDMVNFSTVSLGYTLPQSLVAKVHAQSVKVGLMGSNLYQWQGMKAERGISYPFQRLYSFSVNTTF